MTPYRDRKLGSYILDRQFRGVGRLKRASGTTDPKFFKLLDAMLTTLYKSGRIDILQGIASGVLTPLEVWARFRLNELDRLPTVETMKSLKDATSEWLDSAPGGDKHRRDMKYNVAAILRHGKKNATVLDLPAMLRKYRKTTDAPTMFNRSKSAALSFLRDTLGRRHPIYQEVRDIKLLPVTPNQGRRLDVKEMRELRTALNERTEGMGDMAWSMAITGMGPGEYWGRWTVKPDRVHIHGTKREGRKRDIPYVGPVSVPVMAYRKFGDELEEATGDRVGVYDFRRTFAHWMELAHIPRTRRKLYMGHGATDVTDLYERHEVEQFLAEDGAKLRALLGEPDGPPLRLHKTGAA